MEYAETSFDDDGCQYYPLRTMHIYIKITSCRTNRSSHQLPPCKAIRYTFTNCCHFFFSFRYKGNVISAQIFFSHQHLFFFFGYQIKWGRGIFNFSQSFSQQQILFNFVGKWTANQPRRLNLYYIRTKYCQFHLSLFIYLSICDSL